MSFDLNEDYYMQHKSRRIVPRRIRCDRVKIPSQYTL